MDKKLEAMKKNLEQRVKKLSVWVSCICTLIVCVIANKSHIGGEQYADIVTGLIVGILVGLDLIMVKYISKYRADLKDKKKLEKLCLLGK